LLGAREGGPEATSIVWTNRGTAGDGFAATFGTRANAARAVVEWRRRTKARLVALFGGRCMRCGYDDHLPALVFHHRDPSSKSFAISVDGVPRAWHRLIEEAGKCDLLCANCHREVHAAGSPT